MTNDKNKHLQELLIKTSNDLIEAQKSLGNCWEKIDKIFKTLKVDEDIIWEK